MNKKLKAILIVIVIIFGFFVVESRRVSRSTFDLMVTIRKAEVLEVCNNRLSLMQKDPSIKFEVFSYDDRSLYHSIIYKYGDNICYYPDNLGKVLVEHYKEYYREQWKFVL